MEFTLTKSRQIFAVLKWIIIYSYLFSIILISLVSTIFIHMCTFLYILACILRITDIKATKNDKLTCTAGPFCHVEHVTNDKFTHTKTYSTDSGTSLKNSK
ncbi:hypothetical protein ACJX0J_035832 [Zea mays]